jgi:YhcN/YlaJ family sporulation lipoprotein
MRKRMLVSIVLLSVTMAVGGCVSRNTGDVGQKNIRPYYANDYEKNGIRINGVHSPGSATYRTRFASDQSNERNRRMGRDGLGNNIVGAHDNYRIEMNARIAEQLSRMREVDSAYVLLADQNAYVGIVPKRAAGGSGGGQADLDPRLKDKAADFVKSMSYRTQNVYVTSNPDFIGRMQSYAGASAQGYPVQDFLTEFNALAERVFPGTSGISGTSGTPGNGTDLSNDTGTDTGTERGNAFTGNYR